MRVLLFALALTACARTSQPARLPSAPLAATDSVVRSHGSFDTADGVRLFEQCWRPAHGDPRAVMVVVHGIKDHSGRYHEFASALVGAGFAVCGFDHRGHGRSAGPRFAIHSFARVMDDIDHYLTTVGERFADAPVFLFGHSMGGVMVALYAVDRQPTLAGVIVSSSALRPHIHPFEIAGLRAAAALFPNAPLLDAPDETFSPDPAVVEGMRRDPLIHHGKGTGRMAVELADAIRRVWSGVESIRLPILVLHGVADRATDPRGSVELHQRVGTTERTLHLYPDSGHDLAHDPARERVIADVIAWLIHRTPG